MLAAERAKYIHKRVQRDDAVSVEDLSQELDVSPITIRRDLERLEQEGRLRRTHGGAVRRDFLHAEEFYDSKLIRNHAAKEKMAQACADRIPEGATIILDAGTSTFEVARLLRSRIDLTVVTFDLAIASELYRAGVRTVLTGGEIQNSTGALYGAGAERFVSDVSVDLAVLGVASISINGSLYTPTAEKAALKRAVMQSSRKKILLADESKFSRSSFWKICELHEFHTLITDHQIGGADRERLNADSVEIVIVPAHGEEVMAAQGEGAGNTQANDFG
ncbi:MAG: DeoR/GlpR family DNA-binding transcription regulator [Spirochaeta sp.]|nr:DeoR/GlpR family DNA-binding transcription regulator [Spirochaeta sp.]